MPLSEALAYGRADQSAVIEVAVHVAAALTLAWCFYSVISPSAATVTSDFPTYYTAARLVREHKPLEAFYDYPTFQREISRSGMEQQLGGYVPQTPLTMLPFLPLSNLQPLDAKRVWLVLNCLFLAVTLWWLSQLTRFTLGQLWLIAFLSFPALRQNFLLGQYYILLLWLLTAAAYCLFRARDALAGLALGTLLALKLYGAPFCLFLIAKRRTRAAVLTGVVLLASISVTAGLFGWHGLGFYLTQILPRSIAGETLNPFHPANNTIATFLRRLFIGEPQLNGHPLWDAPPLFLFLQCATTLAVLVVPVFQAWEGSRTINKSELAWWIFALVLVSPNTASYTFVLLILPVALLLDELPHRNWPFLLIPYIVLCLPVRGWWAMLFPKAWLLLFVFVRFRPKQGIPGSRWTTTWISLGILAASAGAAVMTTRVPRKAAAAATELSTSGAIYANTPVATRTGIFYESIVQDRYGIVRLNDGMLETLTAAGQCFHPSVPDSGDRVYFVCTDRSGSSIRYLDMVHRELGTLSLARPDPHDPAVSHDGSKVAFVSDGELFLTDGRSYRSLSGRGSASDPSFLPQDVSLVYVAKGPQYSEVTFFDLITGHHTVLVRSDGDLARPSVSPRGNRLLYGSRAGGSWQVWMMDLTTNARVQVTHGRCNSTSPTWSPDARGMVFSSDCNRGLNLPGLFYLELP